MPTSAAKVPRRSTGAAASRAGARRTARASVRKSRRLTSAMDMINLSALFYSRRSRNFVQGRSPATVPGGGSGTTLLTGEKRLADEATGSHHGPGHRVADWRRRRALLGFRPSRPLGYRHSHAFRSLKAPSGMSDRG